MNGNNNMNMNNGNNNTNKPSGTLCGDLLYAVQMYGFVLDEARLFLDTHPQNQMALDYYKKYSELYREAVAAYERNCGPLTANSESSVGDGWRWIDGGWPWNGPNE